MKKSFLLILIFFSSYIYSQRTVIDFERGLGYGYAYNNEYNKIGGILSINTAGDKMSEISDEAVYTIHGRLQHFFMLDNNSHTNFPFSKLKAYELDEMLAGNEPIFITATYNLKKKPVYFYLHTSTSRPRELWSQAVNLNDERYIKFWINQYVRQVEHTFCNKPNIWQSIDNGMFEYRHYIIENDSSSFLACADLNNNVLIPWDKPFAQNQDEFLESVATFMKRVKELAPDIKIMWNGLGYSKKIQEIGKDLDGVFTEEIFINTCIFEGRAVKYLKDSFYYDFLAYKWLADNAKVCIIRSILPNYSDINFTDYLRTSYVAYSILRGENFFYAPQIGSNEVNPLTYETMKNSLGRPIQPSSVTVPSGINETVYPGRKIYSRRMEGGLVYLNFSGSSQTITLPSDNLYYDRNGKLVSNITINDLSGDYVLISSTPRVARPSILPNGGCWSGGSILVSMETTTEEATIYYTLNGTFPDQNSNIYLGPFTLNNSVVLCAKAVKSGMLDSFVSTATFSITTQLPEINFHLSEEEGSEFLDYVFPLLVLSTPTSNSVTVFYDVFSNTSVFGKDYSVHSSSIIFKPTQKYNYIPIHIIDDADVENDETITVSLKGAINATVGKKSVFSYKIKDNDNRKSVGFRDIISSADTEITSNNTKYNGGNKTYLNIGKDNMNSINRGLIKFDLLSSSITSNISKINVLDANLHIYSPYCLDNGDREIRFKLHRILKNWDENNATWLKATTTVSWTNEGASGENDINNILSSSSNVMLLNLFYVKNDVDYMLKNPESNYGWLIIGPEESTTADYLRFYTKEANVSYIQLPRLLITYSIQNENYPLIAYNICSKLLSKNSVVITWNTNYPATSQVIYGTKDIYEYQTLECKTYTTTHAVIINNLQRQENLIYYYKVKCQDITGDTFISDSYVFDLLGSKTYENFDNTKIYPNPFNLNKTISRSLKVINIPENTTMSIYTIDGSIVINLDENDYGNNGIIVWDGRDISGKIVAPGIYYYLLKDKKGKTKKGKILIEK